MKSNLAVCGTLLCLALGLACVQPALAQDMPGAEEMVTVNVNEADAETIAEALVGIGLTKARAIVDYRERYGRFYSAEELTAVKGIGRSTINKNQGRIKVED